MYQFRFSRLRTGILETPISSWRIPYPNNGWRIVNSSDRWTKEWTWLGGLQISFTKLRTRVPALHTCMVNGKGISRIQGTVQWSLWVFLRPHFGPQLSKIVLERETRNLCPGIRWFSNAKFSKVLNSPDLHMHSQNLLNFQIVRTSELCFRSFLTCDLFQFEEF